MTDPGGPAARVGGAVAPPTHLELFSGMLQVALSAFGGGLSAWSQRIIVERRRWMGEEEFLTGLTVARLFPGPNQINMALFLGTSLRGVSGALAAVAGLLLLPFTLLMGLGVAYFQFHQLPAIAGPLNGAVAAAAGMALSMGFRLLGRYGRDPVALLLALATFLALDAFQVRLVPLVLVVGPLAMAWYWPRGSGREAPPP